MTVRLQILKDFLFSLWNQKNSKRSERGFGLEKTEG